VDAQEFWTHNIPLTALAIVAQVLGRRLRDHLSGEYSGHPVVDIGYSPDFDLATVERELRQQLDRIEWQVVTTGNRFMKGGVSLLSFAVAPIIPVSVTVAYHATRRCLFEKIDREGLLPSTKDRSSTNFPDTEGLIHVCAKLSHNEGENDSAEWWRGMRSKSGLSRPLGSYLVGWGNRDGGRVPSRWAWQHWVR
jgi:hypothetical protein